MNTPIKNQYFLGLYTVLYHAPDIAKTKAWYSSVLGIEPYFDQPYYVGFSVSGYELGLSPAMSGGSGCSVAYWGVADATSSLERLLSVGATLHSNIHDVGDDIKVATVNDPFGNIFGIIQNPHFKLPSV